MIYPKQPKILVDPSNGQQVVLNPKHGLFFIPAKAWTWILGILAVPVMLLGVIGEGAAATEAAAKLDPDHQKKLMVGLRGITSYGSVLQGKNGEEQASSPAGSDDKSVFLPVFAPKAP